MPTTPTAIPVPATPPSALQNTSGMTPWTGSGSFVTVNGQNFAAPTPISVQGMINPPAAPVLPAPVNNTPGVVGSTNAAVSAATGFPTAFKSLSPAAQKAFTDANPNVDPTTGLPKTATPPTTTPATTPSTTTTAADMTTAKGIQQRFLELLGIQATKGTETAKANVAAGVDDKTLALTKLQGDATTLKASYDDQIQQIRDNNPTGQLTGAQQQTITQLTNDRDRALANNATLQLVAQGNLTAATTIATRQIAAEFQPVQDQLDTLKSYLSVFNNDMTDSEKQAATEAYTTRQNDVNTLRTAKSDAVTKLIASGQYTQAKADAITAAQTTDAVNQALVGVSAGSNLSTTQINDGATRAGYDINTFKTLPADVQVFYSQTSDANIAPFRDNLTNVSQGKMSVDDFNTWLDGQSLSPAVKSYFQQAATQAATTAPKNAGGGWFSNFMNWVSGDNNSSTTTPAQ